MYVVLKAEKKW